MKIYIDTSVYNRPFDDQTQPRIWLETLALGLILQVIEAGEATSERQIMLEAAQVIMRHMAPSKATRFWASWQIGEGDYLSVRKELFQGETVSSLYDQIKKFEDEQKK